jgi:flagellar basal body-associated protein FliL
MRFLSAVVCVAALVAGEAAPDPAQAVVAEGACIYRQRDLDALLLVAMRHARAKEFAPDGKSVAIGNADADQIRQAIIRALTAREAFAAALAGLPERVPPAARDAIALDLLSYQAEANPRAAPAAGAPPAPSAGPVLVRLPPFTITRAVDGQGRRQLTLGLALAFADAAAAQAMEAQAPIIQDTVLGALRGMGPELFIDPEHAMVKARLTDAIRAKIPGFPVDGLLIPQLETAPADQPAER